MSARRVTVRRGSLSLRVDLRVAGVLGVIAIAVLALLVAGVGTGDYFVSPGDVLGALVGTGDQATRFIVVDLRLPRALTALLAGAALGIAGAIFQELARNALVSPDVVGVSTGASLAAVTLLVFGGSAGALSVPLAALCGGLGAGVLLYALAWRDGLDGFRLVLVGIGVAAVLEAGILYVLTRGEIFEVAQAYVWLVGSLNGRGWEHVAPLAATLALILPLALGLARGLQALQLGDEIARALGARVERMRTALAAVAIVLTAVAVSATGPIVFAAFIAPHVARRVGRSVAPAALVVLSAGAGAVLILAADLAGRLVLAPTEIPVGIVTALIAAPYFLSLLHRANRIGVSG